MMTAVGAARDGLLGYIRQEQARYGVLFVLPTFLFFCLFIAWPVAYSFYLGFFQWSPLEPRPVWVGLENYQELFSSASFLRAIWEHRRLHARRADADRDWLAVAGAGAESGAARHRRSSGRSTTRRW